MELGTITRRLLGGRGEYRAAWTGFRLEQFAARCGLTPDEVLAQGDDALRKLWIPGTGELFRDPFFFAALRQHILPHLPERFAIWMPLIGAPGDFYSVLITLGEERPAGSWLVYGSDLNLACLQTGAAAPDIDLMYRQNYLKSGARGHLSDFISAEGEVNASLLSRALTGELPPDVTEVDLVVCRDMCSSLTRASAGDIIDRSVKVLKKGGWFIAGFREFASPPHPALCESALRRGIYRKTL